jgi:hypothetical protein
MIKKNKANVIFSIVVPFAVLTALIFGLRPFALSARYPVNLFLGILIIVVSAVLGYCNLAYMEKKRFLLFGFIYFPVMALLLYFYFIFYVCLVFYECP